MIGGRGELVRGTGEHIWRRISTDGSFASSNDPRLLFGLGNQSQQIILRAHWPSGRVTEYRSPSTNRYLTLEETSHDKAP